MAKNNQSTQKKTLWLAETAMFAAIIIIMAFTPLGYLRTPGLEITFIMIPVVVGAIVAGPAAGAILGGVFGLTSFVQCFGSSAFGATLLSINPVFAFIVCMIRILAGWLIGLIYKAIAKSNKMKYAGATVASLVGPLLNTVFFMGALVLLFGRTEFIQNLMTQLGATNVFSFVALFVGVQGLIEAGVCFVVGGAVSSALLKAISKRSR
ncbi:MAG: ECF transporter S component [Ruminococcus sp.]|nr:ECF transporter S component [Ruminococcus sp.]